MEGYINIPKKIVDTLNASTEAVVQITDEKILKEFDYIYSLNKVPYINGFLFSDGTKISGFLDKAATTNGWAMTCGYSGSMKLSIANFVIGRDSTSITVFRNRGA